MLLPKKIQLKNPQCPGLGGIFLQLTLVNMFFFQEDAWLEAQQHSTDELLQTHGRFHGNVGSVLDQPMFFFSSLPRCLMLF